MIIHISDLHFTTKESPKALNERIEALAKAYPSAYILATGDFVDFGTWQNYQRATLGLRPLAGRLLLVPGNHDYSMDNRSVSYSHKAEAHFNDFYKELSRQASDSELNWSQTRHHVWLLDEPTAGSEKVLVAALNTVKRTRNPLDFSRGEVTKDSLCALSAYVNQSRFAGYRRLLALHHRTVRRTVDAFFMELEHTGLVQKFIRDNGFDTVCFGHEGRRNEEKEPEGLAGIKLHNANNFRDNPKNADFIV